MLSFRSITNLDIPALLDLEHSSKLKVEPLRARDLLKRLEDGISIGVLAEVGGRIIGYLIAEVRNYQAHLCTIVVHPLLRRKGVATLLLLQLLDMPFFQALDEWRADVIEDLDDVHRWLQECGFECRATTRRFGERDVYHFERRTSIPRLPAASEPPEPPRRKRKRRGDDDAQPVRV